MPAVPDLTMRAPGQSGDGDPLAALDGRGDGKLRAIAARRLHALLPALAEASVAENDGPMRERLRRLVARGRTDLAIGLLGYALPEREAVWWACRCLVAIPRLPSKGSEGGEAAQGAAIAAAETWVREPGADRRRQCAVAAKEAGTDTAAAYAARAAFAADMRDPLSLRAGRRVAPALRLALSANAGPRRASLARAFIESACDIAAGGAGRFDTVHGTPAAASPGSGGWAR